MWEKEPDMPSTITKRIAVLTSGGDAPGMNAAVRAVVRTALEHGIETYAIYEGYQGLVEGGERIRRMTWDSVGGILQKGGTVIGTARSEAFRTRDGRRTAALNLLRSGINSLVVIGGDGSLTGANIFRQEWVGLLEELVSSGQLEQSIADENPYLFIVGLVGSIDNDMWGTDMTIGADTALHRITEAVDAISSTAASHQRTFVVEVMGRNCGYLALMGGLATGADWVLIPEAPPDVENWEDVMCERLRAGRKAGRRDTIVIVAEGAHDRDNNPIDSSYVAKVLREQMDEDVRVTVLGHVQRGGAPSVFDRNLGTLMGYTAVQTILNAPPEEEPQLVAIRGNRITTVPLMHAVEMTHQVAEAIAAKDFQRAMELRTNSFREAFQTLRTFGRALPHEPQPGRRRLRLGVMNSGAPSPGMNTATRAAVRLGVDKGHHMFGIRSGFSGCIEGDIIEMDWMSVNGWASMGGSELGTNRKVPRGGELYLIARQIETYQLDGLLIIGGWEGYETAYRMCSERENLPAFKIPIICLPASINNNLPGSELAIGADTALNNIAEAVDKIKQSAVATRRVFVVEVMGRYCGYLALMSGMATGTERVYIHEEGISLKDLQTDLQNLIEGFQSGKRLGLIIRNEQANPIYNTAFISALFEEEGGGLFDVRQSILGHLQQGGDPSPFDRVHGTRLADKCVQRLVAAVEAGSQEGAFIGLTEGKLRFHPLEDFQRMTDETFQRARDQWWLELRPIQRLLAQPRPGFNKEVSRRLPGQFVPENSPET
jgi:6-phosphofructokinase 1